MEGKLRILFLFVILNNTYISHVSSQSKDANRSKTNLNTSRLGQQNVSRRNNDEPLVTDDGKVNFKNGKGKLIYKQDNHEIFERPLSVGDTFTPSELVPVTQKLIAKIEDPGQGKGIVSSAKSPEELADVLFEAFFSRNKRIVKLNEEDLSGLDALQALALSGEVTALREHKNVPVTETTNQVTLNFRGQLISVNSEPIKSKYRLITKKDNKKIKKKIIVRRGGIKIAEKLWKKRHLIVNAERKHNSAYKFSKKGETRSGSKKQLTPGNNKTFCHWKYECTNPSDLDTCRLKTDCNKNTPIVEFHGVPHQPDEHTHTMRQFRKMLGITLIDEEVEKILERRYIKLQPPEGRPGPDVERLESLSEYFNNIIMNDFMKSTHPYTETRATTEENQVDEQESQQSETEDGRRIFETPTRSTLKPSNNNM